ncbi:hypothetical protein C497_07689 [Halalkalicoccus jeotgali B3]|uniref:Uncharacterized protein n=1 Tax=Halalkalicoccus jeotgali (strain DSM 18796 / CECT 7217 / JCM 14584 / KCTC 4019 / B3) TaxID=795797 RepID=D8J6S7_HALJB|nr:hypothetical protein HacjB3_12495 [Halalkalicoccus jeotgali B3]ELY37976.1 hypothetical protein C497_07689 [Halalkalicoccus jeotgali B3]
MLRFRFFGEFERANRRKSDASGPLVSIHAVA